MKTVNSKFRTNVFKRAHELVKSTGKAFAVCLAKAWSIYRLKKRMSTDTVKIAFEKVDGTLRIAYATLNNITYESKNTKQKDFKTVTYFDTVANAFRSFRVENFITAY